MKPFRLLAIGLVLIALSLPVSARLVMKGGGGGVIAPPGATTTWNPSDIAAGITLSGGNLTATGDSNPGTVKGVRATNGKFTGKWCYQFTVLAAPSNFNIGLAAADWQLNRSRLGTDDGAGSDAQPRSRRRERRYGLLSGATPHYPAMHQP